MEDLFKKFVNAGVGFVSLTNDRVQKSIDALVKESKLSEKEGAKIMDDLKKNTDSKRRELEKQAQNLASKMLKTVGVAPNSELEELKRSTKSGAKSAAGSAATGSKKAASAKAGSAAKGAATSKAADTVKKAAAKTSATAGKAEKSAAGATKKAENKADAADAK